MDLYPFYFNILLFDFSPNRFFANRFGSKPVNRVLKRKKLVPSLRGGLEVLGKLFRSGLNEEQFQKFLMRPDLRIII